MREYEIVDGRYRIERKLAAGGFGAIYQATDTVMGRQVALKVLHPEFADDAAVVARFRREADALARLRDPHTITMYDVGTAADGSHFIVLELLRGESLYAQFRALGALPWRRVAAIARGVCSSLREAHASGIVHRDLKPANIHLETSSLERDFVKVLDFGIAKIVDADTNAYPDLTLAGQMIGTFDYMAPEQIVGSPCSGKSDVFALAVIMYEMIAGERPFGEAQGPAARLMEMMTATPVPLRERAEIPAHLDAIVMRALSRDVDDRPDAEELDRVLARLLEDTAVLRVAAASVFADGTSQTRPTAYAATAALDTPVSTEVPSDIDAMIDEVLADAPAAWSDDDEEDTWVGAAPSSTVVGLAPTRPPSDAAPSSGSLARTQSSRFAIGSRTELPPAKQGFLPLHPTPRTGTPPPPRQTPAPLVTAAPSPAHEPPAHATLIGGTAPARVKPARVLAPAPEPARVAMAMPAAPPVARPSMAIPPPSIAPAPVPPKLPAVAFALRPTPSELALPPMPDDLAQGTSPSAAPVVTARRKLGAVRYALWAIALFGAGFAAIVGLSQL